MAATDTIYVRLPIEVAAKLRAESRDSGKSMNAIIVEMLEARYKEVREG